MGAAVIGDSLNIESSVRLVAMVTLIPLNPLYIKQNSAPNTSDLTFGPAIWIIFFLKFNKS